MLHQLRELREVLADLDAGHRRVDRLELAADVRRGVGLGVEGVDVAGPAGHPQQDAGSGPRARPGPRRPADPASRTATRRRPPKPQTPAGSNWSTWSSPVESVIEWSVQLSRSVVQRKLAGHEQRPGEFSGGRLERTQPGLHGRGTASARRPSGRRDRIARNRSRGDIVRRAARLRQARRQRGRAFRPANWSEFICRSRCGMPRRYAVGSGSPSSEKNWMNSVAGVQLAAASALPRRRAEDRHVGIVQLPGGEHLDRHPAEERGLLVRTSPGRLVRW